MTKAVTTCSITCSIGVCYYLFFRSAIVVVLHSVLPFCNSFERTPLRIWQKSSSPLLFLTSLHPRVEEPYSKKEKSNSRIRSIRSRNIGGVAGFEYDQEGDIVVDIPPTESLITITGETGTGKSLLFSRVFELLTGAKGSSSPTLLAPNETSAFAEIDIELDEPWRTAIGDRLALSHSFDTSPFENGETSSLLLRRTLTSSGAGRVKSACEINGRPVPLKLLAAVATPLLKVVDASAAAVALSRPSSRLAILDSAVDNSLLQHVRSKHAAYKDHRRERERLENEMDNLPYNPADDSTGMLSHWIKELDAFSSRVIQMCQSVAAPEVGLGDNEDFSAIERLVYQLNHLGWHKRDSVSIGEGHSPSSPSSSNIYACLLGLQSELRVLDEQLVSAQKAVDALSILSAPNSAATAIENARNLLLEISPDTNDSIQATETSHEYLNRVEDALAVCTQFLEEHDNGLLKTLENHRTRFAISVEQLDEIIFEWNSLARKHGVQPSLLPQCHQSLLKEQNGGEEVRARLPRVQAAEQVALEEFENACYSLHQERKQIASYLVEQVTMRMASLGMEDSSLDIQVSQCRSTDATSSGYDAVKFILQKKEAATARMNKRTKQGDVGAIASSGEKARLLLAIECVLPGSMGAATANSAEFDNQEVFYAHPPVAILYDEIDAHVGGRAAVALSEMLRDQSRQSSQVLTITHSPLVAAVADLHIVVQKHHDLGHVRAKVLDQAERRDELARMASGNVAAKEALLFADALLREGSKADR